MVEIGLAIDTKKAERALKQLNPLINGAVFKTMESVGSFGRRHVKSDFLNGPRPKRLGQVTGKLHDSIQYSVIKDRDDISTHIGTSALTAKGFNYPEYWEERGTVHGGPRPFLGPLRDEKKQDLINVFNMVLRKELLLKLSKRGI